MKYFPGFRVSDGVLRVGFAFCVCCAFGAPGFTQAKSALDGGAIPTAEIAPVVTDLMRREGVTGMQIAIVRDGHLVYSRAFGVKDKNSGAAVTERTTFYGASLSKVIFAYLVMQLVEQKKLDLDKPLYSYLPKRLPEYDDWKDLAGDERYKKITARMALSHQTGFPNWRWINPDQRLDFKAAPGARFGYSGEGIQLLQFVVEQMTGKGLDALSRERLFVPLGMERTRYLWDVKFEDDFAVGHDENGKPLNKKKRAKAGAAGSVETTAADFSRFAIALMGAKGLKASSVAEMLRPQVEIRSTKMFGPLSQVTTEAYRPLHLAWGLGWGLFTTPHGAAFFHGGHDDGWEHFTVFYPEKKLGVIFLTNSSNGEAIFPELLRRTIGDVYTPVEWLNFVPDK